MSRPEGKQLYVLARKFGLTIGSKTVEYNLKIEHDGEEWGKITGTATIDSDIEALNRFQECFLLFGLDDEIKQKEKAYKRAKRKK